MQGKQGKKKKELVQFNVNIGKSVRTVQEWIVGTFANFFLFFLKKGGERKKMFCSYKAQEIYF